MSLLGLLSDSPAAAPPRLPSLIQALRDPAAYPHPARSIEVIQTPISWVLLTGDRAYKIKKPLHRGLLDYTTLESRRRFCEEELRLNRRLCPEVYQDVVSILYEGYAARITELGPAMEYAARIRQLPAERMLPHLLAADAVTSADIEAIARVVAAFPAQADAGPEVAAYGTPEVVAANTAENFQQITPLAHERLRRRAAIGISPSDAREELDGAQPATIEAPNEFPAGQHLIG